MRKLKFEIDFRKIYGFLLLGMFFIATGCQFSEKNKSPEINKDFSDQLSKGEDIEAIAEHLIKVRQNSGVTRALAMHYPNLDMETAYTIQMKMLSKLEKKGQHLVGWKMGGAKVEDPSLPFKPLYGFMLASNAFKSGSNANSSLFVADGPLIEAEVGFILNKDLPGPVTTREEVIDAIESVGGYSEFISIRTRNMEGGITAPTAHAIADGVSHGGFIQPNKKYGLNEIDLTSIKTSVLINGKVISEGSSKNFAFIDAILYF